jgi:ribosomal protein L25, Ctc-form
MEEINLLAQARKEVGRSKVKSLRTKGAIPGVVYGEGKKSQAISVDKKTFLRILKSQKGENVIINLSIAADEKKSKEIPVLIKELQHDPVSDELIHIDFNQISLTKEIKVKVPIVAKGEPVGVKQDGGSLAHLLWDLEVECLPTEIPAHIEVDVSNLLIGDAIHVKDLIVPKKVKVLHEPDLVVLSVAPPVKEVLPEEAAVEGAPTEPEVLKEKKEVPGEEGKEEKAERKKKPPRKQKRQKNNFVELN